MRGAVRGTALRGVGRTAVTGVVLIAPPPAGPRPRRTPGRGRRSPRTCRTTRRPGSAARWPRSRAAGGSARRGPAGRRVATASSMRRGAHGARDARPRRAAPRAQGRSRRSGRRPTAVSPATAASSCRSTPLSRPPAISTTGGSNARSAAMTASGWVPWESFTNRTPSTSPTGWSRCSTPVNARGGAPDRVGRDAEQEADGDRGQRVGHVVAARDRELVDGHDPAARPGRGDPAAGQRQTLDRGGDDPAVQHPEPAGDRPVVAVEHGGAAPSPA